MLLRSFAIENASNLVLVMFDYLKFYQSEFWLFLMLLI